MPSVIYDPIGLARGAGGGALIGLAATALWALTGQTLGVSGIVGGIVRDGNAGHNAWRAAFALGVLAAGGIATGAVPSAEAFGAPLPLHWAACLVGGLLVGVGTRLGNGCTSGHGVCGLPRGSPRSLAAVCVFMATGALAAGLSRAPFARAALYAPAPSDALAGGLYIVPLLAAASAAALMQFAARLAAGAGGGGGNGAAQSAATPLASPMSPAPAPPTASTADATTAAAGSSASLLGADADAGSSLAPSAQALAEASSGGALKRKSSVSGSASPSAVEAGASTPSAAPPSSSSSAAAGAAASPASPLLLAPSPSAAAASASPAGAGAALLPFLGAQAFVLGCGLLFGIGLVISGMADPSKVLRFLDFAGADGWDPQLAFVMGGAVCVNLASVQWLARARAQEQPPLMRTVTGAGARTFGQLLPLFTAEANLKIDAPLLAGAALFGLGWGLSGVCPGPGMVAFVSGSSAHFAITPAGVVLGMAAFESATALSAARAKARRSS